MYGWADKKRVEEQAILLRKKYPSYKFEVRPHDYRGPRPFVPDDPTHESWVRTWGIIRYLPYDEKKMPWRCDGFAELPYKTL